jgi:hypothetical protein
MDDENGLYEFDATAAQTLCLRGHLMMRFQREFNVTTRLSLDESVPSLTVNVIV